jgi:hypothetical protein
VKGRSKWFKRNEHPVREGEYEVGYIITSMQRNAFLGRAYWDGVGFLVDTPLMRITCWRGMTKKAHDAALKEMK